MIYVLLDYCYISNIYIYIHIYRDDYIYIYIILHYYAISQEKINALLKLMDLGDGLAGLAGH